TTNSVDGCQSDIDSFVCRKVDTCNTCHIKTTPLSLTLLVFFDIANNAHDTATANHFALVTHWFDACSYFHNQPLITSTDKQFVPGTNRTAKFLTSPCHQAKS